MMKKTYICIAFTEPLAGSPIYSIIVSGAVPKFWLVESNELHEATEHQLDYCARELSEALQKGLYIANSYDSLECLVLDHPKLVGLV